MGNNDPKVGVYPDPDGGTSRNYAPLNVVIQGGAIASGAAAVITAAGASGSAPDPAAFLFLAEAGSKGAGFMGFHAASGTYVALFLFFASLSVVLATVNLVIGLRLRRQLFRLSQEVCQDCEKPGGAFERWRISRKL
jgi:hypothetical protein